MRIGLIARADKTGLGIQTYEFWRHMNPVQTLVFDLSRLNPTRFECDYDLYPGADYCRVGSGFGSRRSEPDATSATLDRFLDQVDVVYTAETPYTYWLFERAKQKGVKTVLHYNYEFLDYLAYRGLPEPDLFLAPSLWHFEDVPFQNKTYLPFPVDREKLPFRQRRNAEVFLHAAGNHTDEDRNGTLALLEAIPYVKSDVRFKIYSMYPLGRSVDARVELNCQPREHYWDVYEQGDVFVMPRRFGGLCLPMNEALSSGMPCVMTGIDPQLGLLPEESLIGVEGVERFHTRTIIESFVPSVRELAERIDLLAGEAGLVQTLSCESGRLAQERSWEVLGPAFREIFESLCLG